MRSSPKNVLNSKWCPNTVPISNAEESIMNEKCVLKKTSLIFSLSFSPAESRNVINNFTPSGMVKAVDGGNRCYVQIA